MSQLARNLPTAPEMVAFWNRSSVPPFLLDRRLLEQHLAFPGTITLAEGEPLRGLLLGRQGGGDRGMTLDALLVATEHRRRGTGRRLLERFAALAQAQGQSWRFGGGRQHLVPGLPEDFADPGASFLSAMGLVPDWHAYDLLWLEEHGGAATWDETRYRLIRPDDLPALAVLMRQFGLRWQEDTARRCGALLEGRPEEMMGAFVAEELIGFCHIWSARSATLGPSTFWLSRHDEAWGGIGPLGVHPDSRGGGYGAGVVEASMAYLRRAGCQRIGVDWTGLPKFYERCGFRPWQSFRGYHPS